MNLLDASRCCSYWVVDLLLSLVPATASFYSLFQALLLYPSSLCCWCCLTAYQQRIHSAGRHGYFLPPCRRKQRHNCTRVCTQYNVVTTVAIEDVIQKLCAPNRMFLDRFPPVRTPEKILLGESRLNAERGVILGYPRPAASLIAGMDSKTLAQLFFDCWPRIPCFKGQSKLYGAQATT
jgi:hypothetical protein